MERISFKLINKDEKIFARTAVKSALRLAPAREALPVAPPTAEPRTPPTPDVIRKTESVLLDQYAPPGVIVNGRMEILHFRGRTGPYLEPPPGQPLYDLFKMVRPGLVADLRIAISQARKQKATVRRSGVRVEPDGSARICDVVVVPVSLPPESREETFAVLFEESTPRRGAGAWGWTERRPSGRSTRGGRGRRGTTAFHEARRRAQGDQGPPSVDRRGAPAGERRTYVCQRGAHIQQRRAPEPERGASDRQGRASIHQRGALYAQRRDPNSERRAWLGQQRSRQCPRQRGGSHRHRRCGPSHPPIYAEGAAHLESSADGRRAPHRRHQAEPRHREPRPKNRRGHRHRHHARRASAKPGRSVVPPSDSALHDGGQEDRRRRAFRNRHRRAQARAWSRRVGTGLRQGDGRRPAGPAHRVHRNTRDCVGQSRLRRAIRHRA